MFQKRRLSWTGTDSPVPSPGLLKCPRFGAEEKRPKLDDDENKKPPLPPSLASDADQNLPDAAGDGQIQNDTKGKNIDGEEPSKLAKYKAGQSSEPKLTWVHVAPILSPRKTCPSNESTTVAGNSEDQLVTAVLPPGKKGNPAMQDSSVTSTTPYKHPKSLKKPSRCQSQPSAEQQSETVETLSGSKPTSPCLS